MPDSDIQKFQGRHHPEPEEFLILKTAPNKDFTDILYLCANLLAAPVAALLIIEKEGNFIKTSYNTSQDEVPNHEALWKITLQEDEISSFDLKQDERFRHVPTNFSRYIAVPLNTNSGEALGLIMIFDDKKGDLDQNQINCLNILKDQIINLVTFRKQKNQYLRVQNKLEQKYRELEKFASVVSHDLKSPLANIISLTELLKEENKDNFNDDTRQYIDYLSQASHSLRSYVDGLLIFYRSEKILEKEEEDVDLKTFFTEIMNLYTVDPGVTINYPTTGILKQVNKAALTQIFMNLISNALKYNNKPQRRVDIHFYPTEDFYKFEVIDNGNGIPSEKFDKIFELFTTLDSNDRDGNPGSGIGLATVQKLLHHMHGEIKIESEPGKGSNFKFKIKRT